MKQIDRTTAAPADRRTEIETLEHAAVLQRIELVELDRN